MRFSYAILVTALSVALSPIVQATPLENGMLASDGRKLVSREVLVARAAAERSEGKRDEDVIIQSCCTSSCGVCLSGSRCSVRLA